ncbi:hypothetical protein ACXO2Y_03780 [Lactobacillus delbrueckii subsp. bulgaricus]|nr:hypothetical protein [Lactobacillus delbrueckii subsp. bulgaricus]MBT8902756.1 hypothetical protein [Lactobacillus delbrueckii subsp. bulgaricus]MBT8915053.1 hypothetical protein [Lactobacillus delbrueckii subsp. bulgaricus]MBT8916731.1 hypothetical protein [Lactobacillus delbrueckii subsp. bulgaricus]MBT8927384.1 hypothetical protein [Lactobacillus delbrueckii subsp. bulgaricus]
MKKADVELGAVVNAKSEEELKKQFQGTVEKIYENSALLAITSFDDVDAAAVSDLNYKLVVSFKNMKPARVAKKAKALSTNNVTIEKVAPTIKADDKDKDKKEKKAPAKKSK